MNNSVQKQLNILDYGLQSLWRKKFKNLCVFFIFTLVIFLLASFQCMNTSLTRTAEKLLLTVPDITVQQLSAGRQTAMSVETIKKLGTIFGITEINPRIWGYYFDETNGAN